MADKNILGLLLVATFVLPGPLQELEPTFTPPPPGKVCALLAFTGPVALTLQVIPKENLARRPDRGVPLAGYFYAYRARTSESLSIAIYGKGDFRKDVRDALAGKIRQQGGITRTDDGRSIWSFLPGMGPGGETEAALLECRDARYEIVIVRTIDYHDEGDPKSYAHHVKSPRKLREIVEAIETLVFPPPVAGESTPASP